MKHFLKFLLMSVVLIFPFDHIHAKEDKELRQQRQAAQKELQAKKTARNQELADATKSFREFTRNLKQEYQALLKDVALEFELKQPELQAARDSRMAEAEADYQAKWSSLFLQPNGKMDEEAITKVQQEAKAYSDEKFRLKKEAAQIAHNERMENEKQQHALLQEQDNRAMEEAASLGLTKTYEAILATPINGELTRQQEQWNEREKKDVDRIHQSNRQVVREFKNGGKIRAWELKNLEEDFQLEWTEKQELQDLESQQMFFTSFLMQPTQGQEVNQQEIMAKFAEIAKQNKLVKIKYNTTRKKNSITRREEKKKLQEE